MDRAFRYWLFCVALSLAVYFALNEAQANPTLTLCQEFPKNLPDGDYVYRTTYIKKGNAWLLEEMTLTAKKEEKPKSIQSTFPINVVPL